MNFLEQLVAEWYRDQGFLVRTNVFFGKRAQGGYEGEMDVVAVRLAKRELVHIETSSDATSWEKRAKRIAKKFSAAEKHYTAVFGDDFGTPQRIAVVGDRPTKRKLDLPQDVRVLSFDDLMREIKAHVRKQKTTISEGNGYLRAVQFALRFGNEPT